MSPKIALRDKSLSCFHQVDDPNLPVLTPFFLTNSQPAYNPPIARNILRGVTLYR
jgi:hypothetical protein